MAETYISPEDVSPQDAQKVLDFLNSAKSAEEIAYAVEIPGERDVGTIVGQHILDRRDELGKFTNVRQVADVPQVGPERFTEIITTLRKTQTGGEVMEIGYEETEIKEYRYFLFSSVPTQSSAQHAHLVLYGGNNVEHIGSANFLDDSATLPKTVRTSGGIVFMYYHRSALPQLIDMLRNEKPVFLIWNGDATRISTSQEPLGEGETP